MLRDLRPETHALMRVMEGDHAEKFLGEVLFPHLGRAMGRAAHRPEIAEGLMTAYGCLQAIYGHYAFARRGKDRADLSELAVAAFRQTTSTKTIEDFLERADGTSLWEQYEAVCTARGRKSLEQLNRGVIAGLAELAQEIWRSQGHGSIARWVVETVRQTRRIEPCFLRIVDIRGVGPKITSLLLRDLAEIYDLERELEAQDRLYIQPIDKWIRMIAPYVIEEPGAEDAADWILAGKLAKYTRRAGVAGPRFNMGASYFGAREVRQTEHFEESIGRLMRSLADSSVADAR